jgi:hypothetical protein
VCGNGCTDVYSILIIEEWNRMVIFDLERPKEKIVTCKFCNSMNKHFVLKSWDEEIPTSTELIEEISKKNENDKEGKWVINPPKERHELIVCSACGRTYDHMYAMIKEWIDYICYDNGVDDSMRD